MFWFWQKGCIGNGEQQDWDDSVTDAGKVDAVGPVVLWTSSSSAGTAGLWGVFRLCKFSSHDSVDLKRCRGGDGGGDGGCAESIEEERRMFLDRGRDGVQEGE